MFGHFSVVLQRLRAIGLLIQARHRNVTDFEQLRRREEGHVGGIVINRIHHAPLLDQNRVHPALLQFNPARQPRRSRPHHQSIKLFLHPSPSLDFKNVVACQSPCPCRTHSCLPLRAPSPPSHPPSPPSTSPSPSRQPPPPP